MLANISLSLRLRKSDLGVTSNQGRRTFALARSEAGGGRGLARWRPVFASVLLPANGATTSSVTMSPATPGVGPAIGNVVCSTHQRRR
jgi:hypothetical protein